MKTDERKERKGGRKKYGSISETVISRERGVNWGDECVLEKERAGEWAGGKARDGVIVTRREREPATVSVTR